MRPRRTYGYVRVSSDEQGRHGTSLAGQSDEIARYCRAQSWPDPVIFSEIESGGADRLDQRVELRRLVAEVERGDVVLVAKTDRWSRDLVHGVASVRELVKRGVRWISIGEGIDAATAQGDSTLGIMAWAADNERKRIKERTVGRRLALRDAGCWAEGHVPFGYRRDTATRRLVIVDSEATIVRSLYERCVAGESIASLARDLCDRNISREGRKPIKWEKKAVHKILRKRWYLGEMRMTDGSWKPSHAPIIDIDTFDKAQRSMSGRRLGGRTASTESRTMNWLLRGLAHCGSCGCRIGSRYSRSTAPNGYYACNDRLRGGDCDEPGARVDDTDKIVSARVVRRLEELSGMLGAVDLKGASAVDTTRLDALRKSAEGHRQRRARLLSLAVDGIMSQDELKPRLAKLDIEARRVDEEIREEERRVRPVPEEVRASTLRDVLSIRRRWSKLAVPERRDILAMLAERIELSDGDATISWASAETLCAATVGRDLFLTTLTRVFEPTCSSADLTVPVRRTSRRTLA
ncbi:MAG: recombinase family protein [Polyangiaceae bacterium]|nr:recombinase family protein [Polyangiaceae bacterium]